MFINKKNTAMISNILDFHTKIVERPVVTGFIKIDDLLQQGKVAEVVNLFGEAVPVDVLEYLYNKADEYFNRGEIENAKIIYLKIANIRDRRINDITKYYVDNSNFNLGIIFTMQNEPKMGKHYGNNLILNSYGIKYGIQFLLRIHNDYQVWKKDFQELVHYFDQAELDKLMKCFVAIRKDIAKEEYENNNQVKSFTTKHLLLLKKVISEQKMNNEELVSKLEGLAFRFNEIIGFSCAVLLDDSMLEVNFIDQMRFDQIDLDRSKKHYSEKLIQYLKEKLVEVRGNKVFYTTVDNYKNQGYFEEVKLKINTEHASDIELLYAFLKVSIFYSQTLLAVAILKYMRSLEPNITFPDSIKKQIKKKLVF